jgi:hypothetical protein
VTPAGAPTAVAAQSRASLAAREVTLLDLLDRLLQGGIAIHGDITLAVADIDLVELSLSLVVGSTSLLGGTPTRGRIGAGRP